MLLDILRMFGKLFEKKARDIDQLICDIAEHNRDSDYEMLFQMIKGRTFYCPVDPSSIPAVLVGSQYVTKAQDAIVVSTVEINGLSLLLLYTSQNDKRLTESYIGIEGFEALSMSLRMNGISGVIFQNNVNSWVGLHNEKVKWILANYGA
jgi:hypothetical protein